MIVNLQNLSFSDIYENLSSWVKAKPENARWLDFYDSGAGTTILELIAGMSTYDAYRIGMLERELTLDFAVSRSSYLMRASALGYPVNRPSAPVLRLTIDSPVSFPLWNKADPIGTYGDRKLSLINTQPINDGTIQLDVYVGCWKEWSQMSSENKDFSRIYLEDDGVDNDLARFFLTINNESIPVTHFAEDLNSENALVKTTVGGIFLQFGDGINGRKLQLEQLDLIYLSTQGRLKDIPSTSQIRLNVGKVISVQTLLPGYAEDSNEKIRALAPAYHSTRRSMISKYDHANMVMAYAGDIVSACAQRKEGACCVVQAVYLFEDEHLMTGIEKGELRTYLNQYKMAGEEIEIVDPIRIGLDIDATVVINEIEVDQDISLQIQNIVRERTMKLGQSYFVGEVVRKISNLNGVLRVYLKHPASDRIASCREYVSLDVLDIKLSTNVDITISHDPDNEGYIAS